MRGQRIKINKNHGLLVAEYKIKINLPRQSFTSHSSPLARYDTRCVMNRIVIPSRRMHNERPEKTISLKYFRERTSERAAGYEVNLLNCKNFQLPTRRDAVIRSAVNIYEVPPPPREEEEGASGILSFCSYSYELRCDELSLCINLFLLRLGSEEFLKGRRRSWLVIH